MKKRLFLIAVAVSLVALFCVGCANEDDNNPTSVPPATPSNLTAQQTVRSQVNLSWSNVADEDSFVVQRSLDSASWPVIANVTHDNLTVVDPGILANKTHWYRVASKNVAGASPFSAPVSIWTWPGVFAFAEDQTDEFYAQSVDGPPDYHEWTWDAAAGAGKLVVSIVDPSQHWVDIASWDTMPNQGWFETKVKIHAWAGTDTLAFFVSRDIGVAQNFVGMKFTQTGTWLRYWTASGPQEVTTNMPLLTADQFHTIRFFHRGTQWIVYFDGIQVWNQAIPDQGVNTWGMVQEWWYDRGSSPEGDHTIWLDDVANSSADPSLLLTSAERGPQRATLDHARPPVKK